ncbi:MULTISPECIES: permease of phosphate ABC transporter [unclassified Flavonifractor]|uniref:permease of phosphate ABC transporter n=1 Tax=unclassified Flavonifractor TaxID=2629267 RepID=UPI001747E81D|nr:MULTISPECIES: permease of phosphate ABC transporter [unclassified Flavonifractor]HIZ94841.1 permease of phosphate ABC transporter [Candidatus Flavonifractor avicola]
MKKLFSAADAYIAKMNWKDLALVKLYLCAAGVMLGLAAPKKLRKWAALGAVVVFVATYLPIMLKFLPHLEGEMRKE